MRAFRIEIIRSLYQARVRLVYFRQVYRITLVPLYHKYDIRLEVFRQVELVSKAGSLDSGPRQLLV